MGVSVQWVSLPSTILPPQRPLRGDMLTQSFQVHTNHLAQIKIQSLIQFSQLQIHTLGRLLKVKVAPPCLTLCDPMDYSPWNFLGQNTGVSILSLLQGIFPTQGLNPSLPHCRQILYQLSHKGSPRILEWVAYPFSSGSSGPKNRTRVSCIAGGFCTN